MPMNMISSWLMLASLWLCAAVAHAGTVTYVYTDPQGTPLAEADASGNITARFEYTPYGVPVPSVGAAPDGVGYTGHVNDPESGLVYMQARYYDPGIGRMLSRDPVTAFSSSDMRHFNAYAYAYNNPNRFIDPDGQAGCEWCKDAWNSTLQFLGIQSADAGAERAKYSQESAKLSPDDSASRSSLKTESRARTPSMYRAAVEAARPSTGAKPGSGGRANVTNARANASGAALKVGGRMLVAATVVQQANEIANSNDPAREVAGAGGMTLGAIGGGEGGVAVGAQLGHSRAGHLVQLSEQ